MFKGGVYKTMTTVLAASALAAAPYDKRVLIVDADSQCNATSFFMPEPVDWQDDHKPPVSQESQGGEGGVPLSVTYRLDLTCIFTGTAS
jgi:hypothetical protein